MNFSSLNFAPQHLSDEAIAACADSALNAPSRLRAERHLASCAECTEAVNEQREAAWALRRAAAPSLSSDLMQRLRNVPLTTELPPRDFTLSPEGTAVFPTFRPRSVKESEPMAAVPTAHVAHPRVGTAHPVRRHSRVLLATAAALVTMGTAGVAAAAVGPTASAQDAPAPSAPARFAPAAFTNHGPVGLPAFVVTASTHS